MECRGRPLGDAFFAIGEKVNSRIRLIATLFFGSLAGIAGAVPARPLYEPEPPAKPTLAPILAGTTWVGKLFSEGEKISFYTDGTLLYGDPGNGGSRGSWKLDGNQLFFEINQYSEYQTVVRGDVIGVSAQQSGTGNQTVLATPGIAPAQSCYRKSKQTFSSAVISRFTISLLIQSKYCWRFN